MLAPHWWVLGCNGWVCGSALQGTGKSEKGPQPGLYSSGGGMLQPHTPSLPLLPTGVTGQQPLIVTGTS